MKQTGSTASVRELRKGFYSVIFFIKPASKSNELSTFRFGRILPSFAESFLEWSLTKNCPAKTFLSTGSLALFHPNICHGELGLISSTKPPNMKSDLFIDVTISGLVWQGSIWDPNKWLRWGALWEWCHCHTEQWANQGLPLCMQLWWLCINIALALRGNL